ncbi:murein transglycosylase A [Emcibacter sp.]|uniref:murein transglycosylase A n=1 Tax=Emcibacter sp. TaxID=1979954 RepID=UPI002AA8D878|nr:MltA domain-containing protein [Emcibacter sp.]
MAKRFLSLGFGFGTGLGLAAGLAFLFLYLQPQQQSGQTETPPPKDYTVLNLSALPGWSEDELSPAVQALEKTCEKWSTLPVEYIVSSSPVPMTVEDWLGPCQELQEASDLDNRSFLERRFQAVKLTDETGGAPEKGLFTGYFSPEYEGSLQPSEDYNVPLYTVPDDLQVLDLGEFDPGLKGRKIVGEVTDGKFIPYKSRREIESGRLDNRGLELVWLKRPEDAFFLHIQGSGVIRLENGDLLRVGYAAKNGRPYRAVGKFLIEEGEISRAEMSMQAIRSWMENNPQRARELMWRNPSYIFFRHLEAAGPVGTLGVPLTAGRSLAIDPKNIPLGIPVWLDIEPENTVTGQVPFRRLMVTQDTGSAIRGRVRGDIFWGVGDEAGRIAGQMKETGTYYLLLPKEVIIRMENAGAENDQAPSD